MAAQIGCRKHVRDHITVGSCRNDDINRRLYLNSEIKLIPRFRDATYEQLIVLLTHHWKEHPH